MCGGLTGGFAGGGGGGGGGGTGGGTGGCAVCGGCCVAAVVALAVWFVEVEGAAACVAVLGCTVFAVCCAPAGGGGSSWFWVDAVACALDAAAAVAWRVLSLVVRP